MAIAGRKKYQVYLNADDVEVLREWLDTRPGQGGLSELLQKHVHRCAEIIRKNPEKLKRIEPGKLTIKKFFQLASLEMP
jgi:hypothetical protein